MLQHVRGSLPSWLPQGPGAWRSGLAAYVLCAAAAGQTTYYVDAAAPCPGSGTQVSPFCTIASALSLAQDGDTVLVRPGTYLGLVGIQKSVALRSDVDGDPATHDPDPTVTILDGGMSGPIVEVLGGAQVAPTIEGFTIQNGSADFGGGVRCTFTSPTIVGNVIRNCQAHFRGGGIHSASSAPKIERNVIELCSAGGGYGGGIYREYGTVVIRSNTIRSCGALRGGGIYALSGGGPIDRNTIVDNVANDGGGGLWIESNLTVSANLIAGNLDTKYGGGGLFVNASHPTVVNNVFASNVATGLFAYGGACHVNGTGGQIAWFLNNTMVGSSAKVGGALVLASQAVVEFHNGIVWSCPDVNGFSIGTQGPCTLTIAHSDIQGGSASVLQTGTPGVVTYGPNNINVAPGFASEKGADGVAATWVDNDLHLVDGSPCVDVGDDALAGTNDIEGDPRPVDGDGDGVARSDMGADERFSHLYHLGVAQPGGMLMLRVVGPSGALAYVYASAAPAASPQPLPPWGDLLLALPIIQVTTLGPIPASGVGEASLPIPPTVVPGQHLYLQAFVVDKLTNLDVVNIE